MNIDKKTKVLFNLLKPRISLMALVKAKKEGFEVRKHSPFGLSPDEFGYVYCVNGYPFLVTNSTREEIEQGLSKNE